jgi:hypothetical protein
MPLLAFWESTPAQFYNLTIEQVVAMAGDGNLRDNSVCGDELRAYLSQVSTERISSYIEHCLTSSFGKSGLVFQDLVNELARRLDYSVDNGKYQGTTNSVGFDGIWRSAEGHTVVAEVKTTDAYTVKLDVIANYRRRLLDQNIISNPSSILIVVGRQDTGELEAQVRGSRHAWDIRLISADALIKLVQLKENSDAAETGLKIRNLITPLEFTRLDDLVDVMFTTATDVETNIVQAAIEKAEIVQPNDADESAASYQFTSPEIINKKRSDIIEAMSEQMNVKLIRNSRALYWDAGHTRCVACSISKPYKRPNNTGYWYAYHPKWDEFLASAQVGFFVLGCIDRNEAFAIPVAVMRSVLDQLNTTTTEKSTYWHVHLIMIANETELVIPNSSNLLLKPYLVEL